MEAALSPSRTQVRLDSWTSKQVVVMNGREQVDYTFPTTVFGPETTQRELFAGVAAGSIDAWTTKLNDVMILVGGQTIADKDHVLFGPRESLTSTDSMLDWGLVPRVVRDTLGVMELGKQIRSKLTWILTISVVEFYMAGTYDLLARRNQIRVDSNGELVGAKAVRIHTASDLIPLLEIADSARSVSKQDKHEGASRSHCAIVLSLYQAEGNDNQFLHTKFNFVNLASSTTGVDTIAPSTLLTMLAQGRQPTDQQMMAAEDGLINYEWSLFTSEVRRATDKHERRDKYVLPKPPHGLPDSISFLGQSLYGRTSLGVVMCLPQELAQDAWTACNYGDIISKLRVPLSKRPLLKLKEELKSAKSCAALAKKAFESIPQSQSKQWLIQRGKADSAAAYFQILDELSKSM